MIVIWSYTNDDVIYWTLNDHVNNDEHLERFEVEGNALRPLPTIGLPMLNTRFFNQVDTIIKEFLTPIMLRKQREKMNQSVCYDINQITEWHHLMEVETDDKEIETILEVWNIRATDTQGIGHYTILLDKGTHLCTCLLLINKGLVCRHFFRVGTYSRIATFHISIILSRWYLNPDVELSDLLQQYPFIPICDKTQSEDDIPFQSHATFQHFFSIRIDSYGPQSSQSSQLPVKSKAIYAELSGLSKKAIDYATKADMQHELLNVFKAFIYDVQGRLEVLTDINNPIIVKHKGRPPKRLISNVEKNLHREKRVLKDIVNVVEEHCISSHIEDSASGTKGQKCSKCKQYGHYVKTCSNVI
uniref:SWIM-type domain-containing protein n=1 Tax=Rhizophagus irregularis (strain DAOM 181602 / DAOM 197198 / MUCL 43194) TaxID=747089 RepID=U9TAX6_RHIID